MRGIDLQDVLPDVKHAVADLSIGFMRQAASPRAPMARNFSRRIRRRFSAS